MTQKQIEALGYTHVKKINNLWCGIERFAFTTGLVVGIDDLGYAYRYCFDKKYEAVNALKKYTNLTIDPTDNWIKKKGLGIDYSNPNYRKESVEQEQSAADDYLDHLSDQW